MGATGSSLIAQETIPQLAQELKPELTAEEINHIYAIDDLDMQAALQTSINQTLQLHAALDILTEEEQ